MKGIDVSEHNGNINWNNVKVDFAILRLGWIGNKKNHTLDTKFERNYNECKRLGIPVGVYVYNYCVSETAVKSGANWTVSKLQGKKLELPVYIDMEDKSGEGLGKTLNTNMCIAFNTIIEHSGRWAGVYANLDWFNNKLNKEEIRKRYTTWIAHYGVNENKYRGIYDILQYSDNGRVNGITGRVDMNIMYRDLIKEINENKVVSKPVKPFIEYYPICKSTYKSIVDALNSVGVNSSYNFRKKIAIKNNIHNYSGTAEQNQRMLVRLKAGRLIKV